MFPIGEGAEVNADLNPAQDDYPRAGTDAPIELTSRPIRHDDGAPLVIAQGHDADVREYDAERAAKAGVSTTTIQDAAKGAAKGVGYGLGVGALAAVASLAIPGFGLVLGGGALAVAVAGLAASAGAGAVAGGVVGYLKDQGVPADEIPAYQSAYEDGGAILSVAMHETTDTIKVQEILRKYGASNVRPFGYAA